MPPPISWSINVFKKCQKWPFAAAAIPHSTIIKCNLSVTFSWPLEKRPLVAALSKAKADIFFGEKKKIGLHNSLSPKPILKPNVVENAIQQHVNVTTQVLLFLLHSAETSEICCHILREVNFGEF